MYATEHSDAAVRSNYADLDIAEQQPSTSYAQQGEREGDLAGLDDLPQPLRVINDHLEALLTEFQANLGDMSPSASPGRSARTTSETVSQRPYSRRTTSEAVSQRLSFASRQLDASASASVNARGSALREQEAEHVPEHVHGAQRCCVWAETDGAAQLLCTLLGILLL